MGQYFAPVCIDSHGIKVYNLKVQGINTPSVLRLTEHSWWDNPFMKSINARIYKNLTRIAWVGDYCNQDPRFRELSKKWREVTRKSEKILLNKIGEIQDIYSEEQKIDNTELDPSGFFLFNHTKKQYIDLSAYKERSEDKNGWIIHPLPILTAIGNGLGGGDYFGEMGKEYIGTWALDVINIDTRPIKYYELLDISFVDNLGG